MVTNVVFSTDPTPSFSVKFNLCFIVSISVKSGDILIYECTQSFSLRFSPMIGAFYIAQVRCPMLSPYLYSNYTANIRFHKYIMQNSSTCPVTVKPKGV